MLPTASAHRQRQLAVISLLLCGLLLSSAGLVIRQLDSAAGFEVTFWRSLGCLVFVAIALARYGQREAFSQAFRGGLPMLASGVCWAIMFTCFSVALSLTTVAKALVLIALSPLFAAILASLLLGERIAARTWIAIALAGIGTLWMISDGLAHGDAGLPYSHWGMLIAAGVPLASAFNFILIKKHHGRLDLLPAVMFGALISCVAMIPFVFPVQASASDLLWMLGLGVFQIGIPCSLIVLAARILPPQEASLLLMLEVVCGPIWVWIFVGEQPATATLLGGGLVLIALVANELFGLLHNRWQVRA